MLSSLLIAISVCWYSPIFAEAETDPASNLEFRFYDFSTPIYVVAGIADCKASLLIKTITFITRTVTVFLKK